MCNKHKIYYLLFIIYVLLEKQRFFCKLGNVVTSNANRLNSINQKTTWAVVLAIVLTI